MYKPKLMPAKALEYAGEYMLVRKHEALDAGDGDEAELWQDEYGQLDDMREAMGLFATAANQRTGLEICCEINK